MTPAILLPPHHIEVLRGMADDAGDVVVPAGELHTLLAAHEDARALAASLPVLLGRLERSDALLRALVRNGGAPEVVAGVEAYLSQRFQEVPNG